MKAIILIIFFLLSLQADENYKLGEGFKLPNTPLYIGGYFSSEYINLHDENIYKIDDVAFLAYGSFGSFSFMSELEYKELYIKTFTSQGSVTTQNQKLHIERLYIDYIYNEDYMLRIGKYNSPIGFWNMLPINVLRQTSSNPYSTKILFPQFTTGLHLQYANYTNGDLKIDALLQNNTDADKDYNNFKIDKHYGLGLSYENDSLALKFNTGYFNSTQSYQELYYLLLSAKYEEEKYQFMFESGMQFTKNKSTVPYAAYIQGLYRFSEQNIGAIRLETYYTSTNNFKENIAVFAYTYRPLYPVAFKGEYQLHSKSYLNQVIFSFSVLF